MVINEDGTPYNKYPSDYSLWKIADYDTRTGQIKPLKAMERVKRASELVIPKEQ